MAATEYEPGTVAVATVRGVEGVRVMRLPEGDWAHAVRLDDEASTFGDISGDALVTDVSPLVVLSVEDIEAHDLVGASEVLHATGNFNGTANFLREIAESAKPPRIPEPTKCGASVIASQTGEIEASDRLWVRFRHGTSGCWIDQYEHVRSWDDLDNPRAADCDGA